MLEEEYVCMKLKIFRTKSEMGIRAWCTCLCICNRIWSHATLTLEACSSKLSCVGFAPVSVEMGGRHVVVPVWKLY
jgi:hypothetical protein